MSELRHQEIIDRINYQYTDINGNVNFPNSFEGDVLKIAYKTAVAALKPQLNPNQQIVLDWLKKNYFDSYFKAVISNLFFFIRHDDIDGFPNETSHKMVEAYGQLSNKEFAKVLEIFSKWVQEQEE